MADHQEQLATPEALRRRRGAEEEEEPRGGSRVEELEAQVSILNI
jgi:hypothetical protein